MPAPARAAHLPEQRHQLRRRHPHAPRPLLIDPLRQPVRHAILLIDDARDRLGAFAVHERRHLQRAGRVALVGGEAGVAGGVGVLHDGGGLVHLAVGLGELQEGRELLGCRGLLEVRQGGAEHSLRMAPAD